MKISRSVLFFIAALAVIACYEAPLPTDPEPYAQLRTGNYWVYQHYTVQPNGVAIAKSTFDSIWIEKDTVIGGKVYQKVWTNQDHTFLNITDNRITDVNGGIIFNATPLDSIVRRDTLVDWSDNSLLAIINYAATDFDSLLIVPAGDFRTVNFKGTFELFPPFDSFGIVRHTHAFYAPGIGKIKDVWFDAFAPEVFERRLVRFHVE